jgi:predicted patatin/cPLA2 family phospholipase
MNETTGGQSSRPRRALILAGGGVKVAFQAGAMQVWLDEAKIEFDHADGASGGCFNLAMYCQGMSGRRIADNWRAMVPVEGISFNWVQFERLFFAKSLFTLDGYRKKVFTAWGLDWPTIRASSKLGTFNLYNFSKHRLEVLEASAMDEDRLCASVSLPMWFPPVILNGDTYIDAVYNTDANLEEAIRRGANEIWVIWTVSESGVWSDGFVNNYFQIIEAAANGRFHQICDRIEANNTALAGGRVGEFGRKIDLKILRAEVDLNYLFNVDADRFVEAVNKGVQMARDWCTQNGIAFTPLPDPPKPPPAARISLSCREVMKGFVSVGETDYDRGLRKGQADGTELSFHLEIKTEDVDRFVTTPQHEASANGSIMCAAFGGERPLQGAFNLLIDSETSDRKIMYYRLFFSDASNNPLTLLCFKDVHDDPGFDVWTDTTTAFTRVVRGHVDVANEATAEVLAAGIIHIHMLDFLHQLTTFRVEGGTLTGRASALTRFGKLFLGKLWDVYARHVLPSSPI